MRGRSRRRVCLTVATSIAVTDEDGDDDDDVEFSRSFGSVEKKEREERKAAEGTVT